MSKPTYNQLVKALRDYSTILHELESFDNLVLSEEHDEKWAELTALEQEASK